MKWHAVVLDAEQIHALYTPRAMAEVDKAAEASGTSIARLMERAGFEVANRVAALHPFGVRVAVLAGPGNNGGDAFVAARVLAERGYKVTVVDAAGEARPGPAGDARAGWRGPSVAPDAAEPLLARADVILDGLLGGGLSRPPAAPLDALIAASNASRAAVLAIDLPSGVDGATGAVPGAAVVANRTLTFEAAKPGHLLAPGRRHAGMLEVVSIGMPAKAFRGVAATAVLNAPPAWDLSTTPLLARARHKYDRGHAVVVSGPMAATGAARLAAAAALRAGAGLVTVASPSDALLVNACHLTTVMVRRADGAEGLALLLSDARHNAVVLGPGLPPEGASELVLAALASPAQVVLDAGALTAFVARADGLAEALRGRGAAREAVLTPHEGEFARSVDLLVPSREGADKLSKVRDAAAALGAVILLKGEDTVIAEPGGRATINANAPPWLATAGTGDVLAGLVGAFLAQGFLPYDAARVAVWLHGELGQRAGAALIADDLIDALKPARAELEAVLAARAV
ncbi:NAD(P)H-hydrate dehydratase [Acuticoccus sp.]|uniref:NAD(P)H-hydrate dehydratase n=1 Tax=Acuticoccus sp. TaxID=1904378 RepID=UPI003B52282E